MLSTLAHLAEALPDTELFTSKFTCTLSSLPLLTPPSPDVTGMYSYTRTDEFGLEPVIARWHFKITRPTQQLPTQIPPRGCIDKKYRKSVENSSHGSGTCLLSEHVVVVLTRNIESMSEIQHILLSVVCL